MLAKNVETFHETSLHQKVFVRSQNKFKRYNRPITQMKYDTMAVAQQGFERFTHGLATGEWDSFLDMLSDDFTFWFPIGAFHGLNVGKERAREFFEYVNQVFNGIEIESIERVTSSDTTVVFEFRDKGYMRGEPYKNRVAVSFDIRGDKICGYREYLGSDGKSN